MDKPPHDTLVPQRRGERKMACDVDDREGESPSPMEPRLGRMFHSSATGHRRVHIFLRRSVFVKPVTYGMKSVGCSVMSVSRSCSKPEAGGWTGVRAMSS